MSMRENPVYDYGLVLNYKEFEELIKKYYIGENKKEILDELEYEDLTEIMYELFDKFYSNSQFSGELDGIGMDSEDKYFEDEEVFILPLLKGDALFQKYENMEEIYNEIEQQFDYMNLKFDLDFVKKHIGKVTGTYWG